MKPFPVVGQTLVTAHEMREMDRLAIEELGIPGRALMELAGREVARQVESLCPSGSRVLMLCGVGNNGGDGFVAARFLAEAGYAVSVFVVGEPGKLKGDAKGAYETLARHGKTSVRTLDASDRLENLSSALGMSHVVVDALFGTGLSRNLEEPHASVLRALNNVQRPIVAVDIPSGVDSDTGSIHGIATQATHTVTFCCAKRGHYIEPGASHCGEILVADIGIPSSLAARVGSNARRVDESCGPALLRSRDPLAHKGTFGHCLVWAGSPSMPGSAVLVLQGAVRAGAGKVTWLLSDDLQPGSYELPPEVLLSRYAATAADRFATAAEQAQAIVIGPGLGLEPHRALQFEELTKREDVPLCIDADGLNLLAEKPKLWNLVKAPCVLTPHPKEMARLLNRDVQQIQANRFAAVAELSTTLGAVVVLKGAGSVVGHPDGNAYLVDAGNPGMATAGSGDVLAGIIGAFLAQGYDAAHAALLGTLLHAVAGDVASERHGQTGSRASDFALCTGDVLAKWERTAV